MTGQDIIDNAKSIYSVETFLNNDTLVKYVNQARERVNKLMDLSYSEYSFTTEANEWRYFFDDKFYVIYRAEIDIGNSLVIPLEPALEGKFPLRNTFRMFPVWYSFTPMDKITLYPCPDKSYPVYLYGNSLLTFNYTTTNLDESDIIPDHFLEPISFDVARRIATFDQNYELAGLFSQEFYNYLKVAKV